MKKVAVYVFNNRDITVKTFTDQKAWEEAKNLFNQSTVSKDGKYRLITSCNMDYEDVYDNYSNVGLVLNVVLERLGCDIRFDRQFHVHTREKKLIASLKNKMFVYSCDLKLTDEFWDFVQGTVQNDLGFKNAIIDRQENTVTFKED